MNARGEGGSTGHRPEMSGSAAGQCDSCGGRLPKEVPVFWIAGTAGYDAQGEPFVGALTRSLFCRRCASKFSRILGAAWDRESDRIAGRNLSSMPDLRRRKRSKTDGENDDPAVTQDAQPGSIPGDK